MNEKANMTDAARCRVAWELRMAKKNFSEIAVELGLQSEGLAEEMVGRGAIGVMDELARIYERVGGRQGDGSGIGSHRAHGGHRAGTEECLRKTRMHTKRKEWLERAYAKCAEGI